MEVVPYVLLDAVEQNRLHPRTFQLPRHSEIAALRVGDLVKVYVKFDPATKLGDTEPETRRMWAERVGEEAARHTDGERFWVEIVSVERLESGARAFRGRVDNNLAYKAHHGLDYGQEMAFEGRHILNLDPRPRGH